MKKAVFCSLLLATCLHGFWLYTFETIDVNIWSTQVQNIIEGSADQFEDMYQYTPMGPLLYGTAIFHFVGLNYHDALILFLTVFDSGVIALIAGLTYLLFPNSYIWSITTFLLSFNYLYNDGTPSTIAVSLLSVALLMLTLYIRKSGENIRRQKILLFSFIAFLAISLRIEVGTLMLFFMIFILRKQINKTQTLSVILFSYLLYFITDPFNWSQPLSHLSQIFFKIIEFHGTSVPLSILPNPIILSFSILAIISLLLSAISFFLLPRNEQPIPKDMYIVLCALTTISALFLLSSSYHPPRYFMPIVLIWHALLPIYLNCFLGLCVIQGKKLHSWQSMTIIGSLLIFVQGSIFYVLY